MGKRICSIEGCERVHKGHGWCATHLWRWHKHGDPFKGARPLYPEECTMDDCSERYSASGLCEVHYQQRYKLQNADVLRAQASMKAVETYAAAKAEGRCAYKSGRGCDQPAIVGHILCAEHRDASIAREQRRRHRIYERSYADRGLIRCWMCNRSFTDAEPRHHDHLIPKSLGGPDDAWNRAPAHGRCNQSRQNTPLAATVAEYHPNGIADPAVAAAVQVALDHLDEAAA